jgi:hypothetical protein
VLSSGWSKDRPTFFEWIEGAVDEFGDRMGLWHKNDPTGVAVLVGPPEGRIFPVRILARDPIILADVRDELDFYLIEVGGPHAWNYARYHAGTFANAYSKVHWGFLPAGGAPTPTAGHLPSPESAS